MSDQPVLSEPCPKCGLSTEVRHNRLNVCPKHGPVHTGNLAFLGMLTPLTKDELRDPPSLVGDDW